MVVWKQSSNNTFSTRKCAPDVSRVFWRTNTRVHGCKWRSHCCRGTSRKETFFGFYHDNGWDVGVLLHAREQTFFNAVASPRISETQKAKTTFSAGKVTATIFWDSKGVLYVDFLTEHRTINAEYYSALLEGPVKAAIKNKRKKGANICVISPG